MAWAPHRLETERLILRPSGVGDPHDAGRRESKVGLPDQWHIVPKAFDRVVGMIGFIRWDRATRCGEIGFGLARAFADRGWMTEACRAVLAYGFEQMGLVRIEARCRPSNPASARVLEKSGMVREATVRSRVHSKSQEEDFWLYAVERGRSGS